MKNLAILFVSIIITVVLLSSCGAHRKCDAYSSIHRDKTENVRY
jgi:hypothetical protein